MKKTLTPFDQACAAAGNQTELAILLGRPKSTVARWRREGVPLKDCVAVHKATGVPCEKLRPDFDWAGARESVADKPDNNKRR
jgi:DNA-binding transcriptional regulator YdaS (Cro superfamily)